MISLITYTSSSPQTQARRARRMARCEPNDDCGGDEGGGSGKDCRDCDSEDGSDAGVLSGL